MRYLSTTVCKYFSGVHLHIKLFDCMPKNEEVKQQRNRYRDAVRVPTKVQII